MGPLWNKRLITSSGINATTASVPTGNIYTGVTLTCKLSDIVSDFDISFESADFENMTSPITATNGSILVTQGVYNSVDLTKEAEVVIGAESIEGLPEGNYSVTCFVDYLNDTQEMDVIIPGKPHPTGEGRSGLPLYLH